MVITKENNWLHFTIDEPFHHQNIQVFFDFYKISRKQRYLLIEEKRMVINQKPPNSTLLLEKNDVISILAFPSEQPDFIAQELPFDIAYEDDYFLICIKNPNILVHPDDKTKQDTLANAVSYYYKKNQINCLVRPIHRLDYDTSGLIIFSKCSLFQPLLDAMIFEKKIKRFYLALVEGKFNNSEQFVISKKIGKDRHNSHCRRVSNSGLDAITLVRPIGYNFNNHYSLIECQLKTGRTHQIRVHMQSILHPLLADTLYGHSSPLIKRTALHAYKIEMIHPITQQFLQVEIPLFKDMEFAEKLLK